MLIILMNLYFIRIPCVYIFMAQVHRSVEILLRVRFLYVILVPSTDKVRY